MASSSSDCFSGLVTYPLDPVRAAAIGVPRQVHRGEHHHRRLAHQRRLRGDQRGRAEPVDPGHHHVEEDELVRIARRGRAAKLGERRDAAVDGGGAHPPVGQDAHEDAAVDRVVVDDECRQIAQVGDRHLAARGARLHAAAEASGELEGAPLPLLALDARCCRPSFRRAAWRWSARARCRRSAGSSSCRPARTPRRCASASPRGCRCRCR